MSSNKYSNSYQSNSNAYTNYRHLTGTFTYSKKIIALALYSGTVGAILNNNHSNSWYHNSLDNATTWLRDHNPYFKPYQTLINRGTWNGPPVIFPTASPSNISQNQEQPVFNINSRPSAVIVPPYDFDTEIHNEDYHYSRLMAGFLTAASSLQARARWSLMLWIPKRSRARNAKRFRAPSNSLSVISCLRPSTIRTARAISPTRMYSKSDMKTIGPAFSTRCSAASCLRKNNAQECRMPPFVIA